MEEHSNITEEEEQNSWKQYTLNTEEQSNITEEEQSVLNRASVITKKLQNKIFDDNKRDLHDKYINKLNDEINRYEQEIDQIEEKTIKYRNNLRTRLTNQLNDIITQKERIGVYTGNCIHGKFIKCHRRGDIDGYYLTCGVCKKTVSNMDLLRIHGKII